MKPVTITDISLSQLDIPTLARVDTTTWFDVFWTGQEKYTWSYNECKQLAYLLQTAINQIADTRRAEESAPSPSGGGSTAGAQGAN